MNPYLLTRWLTFALFLLLAIVMTGAPARPVAAEKPSGQTGASILTTRSPAHPAALQTAAQRAPSQHALLSSPIATERVVVDDDGDVGASSDLALNSSGHPVISYYDVANENLKLAVCKDALCSNPVVVTLAYAGNVGSFNSLALTPDDRPVVSYYEHTNGNLILAVCNDPDCSSYSTTLFISGNGSAGGWYNSLALNSSGHPVIAYQELSHGYLELILCHNLNCTDSVTRILDSGSAEYHSSLILDSAGRPIISYHDATANVLRLAVCENPTCDSHANYLVDDGSGNTVGTHNSLALNGSGFPVISYVDETTHSLKLAVCQDITCNNPILTTLDDSGGIVNRTSLRLSAEGWPVISYYDGIADTLNVAVCGDPFCSHPTLTVVDRSAYASSLMLDNAGRVVLSYAHWDGNANRLQLAVCGICQVPTLVTVDSVGDVGRYPSLAITDHGLPAISYQDVSSGGLKLAICRAVKCTNPIIRTVDSAGGVGEHSSLALTSNDYPVISYLDYTNGDLKLALCGDPTCTHVASKTIDSTGDVGWFSSLGLNINDIPLISYQMNPGFLKLAVCNDPNCSSFALQVIEDDPGDWEGWYTSLALDETNRLFISNLDVTNFNLELVICADPACTSPAFWTVDSVGNVGHYSSLTLNSREQPVISYYDDTNKDLKLAICNRACSGYLPRIVDSRGAVGGSSAMILTRSDQPVISYRDDDKDTLKLAVCNDPGCSNPTLTTVDSLGNTGWHTTLGMNSAGYLYIAYYKHDSHDLRLAIFTPAELPLYLPVVTR